MVYMSEVGWVSLVNVALNIVIGEGGDVVSVKVVEKILFD